MTDPWHAPPELPPTHKPAAAAELADLVATARATLAVHLNDNGFCRGCDHHFGQLKPHPCEQGRWAAAVIEHATPGAGRDP